MIPRPDTKHSIQLFQRPFLRFGEAKIGKHPTEEIPKGVEAKGAGSGEGGFEGGPGEGEDEVEAPGGGGGEGHAIFTDVKGLEMDSIISLVVVKDREGVNRME